MSGPKSSDVLRSLRAHMKVRAHAMRRFPTGLAHYVYEVMTDNEPIVVRMADPEKFNGIPGSVYWHSRLSELGVPLPALYGFNLEVDHPYMILDRLPGSDLGSVYPSLTTDQKSTIARKIAAIQDLVANLPHANDYGWLDRYDNPTRPFKSWQAVLESGLAEAAKFISQIGIFDPLVVDSVRKAAAPYEIYFREVRPAPFLDDTTTKNVLVFQGELSGIVDVDTVCFGDRLYVLALTHTALLSMGEETSYIGAWAEAWQLDALQLRVMNLYTAMHGVYFMSEIGRMFNKEKAESASREQIERLEAMIPRLLAAT